jgi:hypothetical protein
MDTGEGVEIFYIVGGGSLPMCGKSIQDGRLGYVEIFYVRVLKNSTYLAPISVARSWREAEARVGPWPCPDRRISEAGFTERVTEPATHSYSNAWEALLITPREDR